MREALGHGSGLVLATRTSGGNGHGVRRVEAMIGGDRALLEALALGYGDELRSAGVEIVTTGWLRHAERVRAARTRGRS